MPETVDIVELRFVNARIPYLIRVLYFTLPMLLDFSTTHKEEFLVLFQRKLEKLEKTFQSHIKVVIKVVNQHFLNDISTKYFGQL